MMSSMLLQKLEKSGVLLAAPERAALEEYEKSGEYPLSPRTSAEFLQLFLQGYSTAEIQKLNPGFVLGIIVAARVEHEWDRHRADYINGLLSQTRETVQKTQLEAIRFASDGMTVYHRLVGAKFKKFLQSGREEDLGELSKDISIKNYREYAGLLLQLTGQDNNKKVSGEIHHTMEPQVKPVDVSEIDGADLLKWLDEKNK